MLLGWGRPYLRFLILVWIPRPVSLPCLFSVVLSHFGVFVALDRLSAQFLAGELVVLGGRDREPGHHTAAADQLGDEDVHAPGRVDTDRDAGGAAHASDAAGAGEQASQVGRRGFGGLDAEDRQLPAGAGVRGRPPVPDLGGRSRRGENL